jgi:hypothetical protein
VIEAIIAGLAVATVNAGIAWAAIALTADRKFHVFLAFFGGGVLFRLVAVGLTSYLLLTRTSIDRAVYIFVLIGAYILFMILEIALITRQARQRKIHAPSAD